MKRKTNNETNNKTNTTEGKIESVDIYRSNYLPFVFLRYAKKLARDAALPSLLLLLAQYFQLWEKIVLNNAYFSIYEYFSAILSEEIKNFSFISTFLSFLRTETFLVVLMSVIVHDLIYIPQNIIYTLIDYFNLFPQYKIERNLNVPPPSSSLIQKTIGEALLTHLIGQPLAFLMLFPFFKYFGCSTFEPIPHFSTYFLQFVIISLITDAVHYTLHRSAHHPLLYRFHKQHHEYKRTIGIASEYSSLFESLTINFIPVFIGPMIMGCHISLWLGWVMLRTYESTEAHTGYEFPYVGLNTARFHDYHHSQNIGNFGIGDFWDSVCQTNVSFLRHIHKIKSQLKSK